LIKMRWTKMTQAMKMRDDKARKDWQKELGNHAKLQDSSINE